MGFSGISGQERVVEGLKNGLVAGRLHHSLLFTGPRGVGKRTTAMALAAAVNCTGRLPDGDACMECPSCLKVRSGSHPDLHMLMTPERAEECGAVGHLLFGGETGDDEGNKGESQKSRREIRIGAVRDLEVHMDRKPMESGFKVALIVDADRLNIQAANALLKTLEEPAGDSLLVLTSAAPSRMPTTVLSRCRSMRFMALPEAVVTDLLTGRHGVPREKARVLAHVAGGSVGRALQLDGQGTADWVLEAVGMVAMVPWMTATEALGLAEELGRGANRGETSGRLLGLFDALGVYYRDVAAGAWLEGWAAALGGADGRRDDPETALSCFEFLDESRQALELHCNPQLTLESLFMKMRAAARGRATR